MSMSVWFMNFIKAKEGCIYKRFGGVVDVSSFKINLVNLNCIVGVLPWHTWHYSILLLSHKTTQGSKELSNIGKKNTYRYGWPCNH